MKSIAQSIRESRIERDWTQSDLADLAGVSRPTIARIEAGEDVSMASIEKVATALGSRVELAPGPRSSHVLSRVALPESTYLTRIGELAYTVSAMEWTILGDLHRLAADIPSELNLKRLEPMMTAGIARAVKNAARRVPEGQIKDYLIAVYRALFLAAELRNAALHARPATHPQLGQRLNRSEVRDRNTTGKRFWIDDNWFNQAFTRLNDASGRVHVSRPPFK